MALQYVKGEQITLKGHSEFNEAWLQERIAQDTSILGLGEVELVPRERRQTKLGAWIFYFTAGAKTRVMRSS
jgi:hypothetical protein